MPFPWIQWMNPFREMRWSTSNKDSFQSLPLGPPGQRYPTRPKRFYEVCQLCVLEDVSKEKCVHFSNTQLLASKDKRQPTQTQQENPRSAGGKRNIRTSRSWKWPSLNLGSTEFAPPVSSIGEYAWREVPSSQPFTVSPLHETHSHLPTFFKDTPKRPRNQHTTPKRPKTASPGSRRAQKESFEQFNDYEQFVAEARRAAARTYDFTRVATPTTITKETADVMEDIIISHRVKGVKGLTPTLRSSKDRRLVS